MSSSHRDGLAIRSSARDVVYLLAHRTSPAPSRQGPASWRLWHPTAPRHGPYHSPGLGSDPAQRFSHDVDRGSPGLAERLLVRGIPVQPGVAEQAGAISSVAPLRRSGR